MTPRNYNNTRRSNSITISYKNGGFVNNAIKECFIFDIIAAAFDFVHEWWYHKYISSSASSALTRACHAGQFEAVKQELLIVKMLAEGGDHHDINAEQDSEGNTPFMIACGGGHIEIVDLLIDHLGSVNDISNQCHQKNVKTGNTGLSLACQNGHLKIVKKLIDLGADINETNDSGYTPFLIAAVEGHIDIVNLLIDRGVDINQKNAKDGNTAYLLACGKGHLDVVQKLVSLGADTTTANNNNENTKFILGVACIMIYAILYYVYYDENYFRSPEYRAWKEYVYYDEDYFRSPEYRAYRAWKEYRKQTSYIFRALSEYENALWPILFFFILFVGRNSFSLSSSGY